jgi:CBS domain containing-hemolysin-like protein
MDLGGTFVGVLTRARLIYALHSIGPEARIVDVMVPADEVPVCSPRHDLATVWEKMAETGSRDVAIKDGNNFLGLITIDDINEVFQVFNAALSSGRNISSSVLPPPPPASAPETSGA